MYQFSVSKKDEENMNHCKTTTTFGDLRPRSWALWVSFFVLWSWESDLTLCVCPLICKCEWPCVFYSAL